MFAKVFALAALATAVVAQSSTCSTGPVQCCNSVQNAQSADVHKALFDGGFSLVDIVAILGDIAVPIGVTCSPITALGVTGNSCSAQTVCCDNNNFNGVVALGCTPININA